MTVWVHLTEMMGAYAPGQVNPQNLNGKDYSPFPYWVADGMYLKAVDGPTQAESEWDITPRYEWPLARILPSIEPSPELGWRSLVDNTDQWFAIKLSTQGDTELLSDTIGLYLDGCNWRSGAWQKYDGGSWVTILNFDFAADTNSLTYIHNNGGVRPGTGTEAATTYIAFNELAGGTFIFANAVRRRILGNTEGFWQADTTGVTKQATLWLDGIDGTEDTSGSTGVIVYPRIVCFAHMAAATIQSYRIYINGAQTVDDYYTIGTCVVGPVVIFGHDNDWGRARGLTPQTALITDDSGGRRSRRMGKPRRSVELPWTGGVDLTSVSGATPSDDYVKGTSTAGGLAVALRHDQPWKLEGLLDYLGGSHIPVVYCPRIPKGTPDTDSFSQWHLSLYGRIVSDYREEVVVGDEWTSEVVRVPGVTIEEER